MGRKVRGPNPGRRRCFSLLQMVHIVSGAHPSSYSIGTGNIFQGKAAGAWISPLTPTQRRFKNEWSYTSTPPMCLHGVDSDNFTFLPAIWYYLAWSPGKHRKIGHEQHKQLTNYGSIFPRRLTSSVELRRHALPCFHPQCLGVNYAN
jgi:hypothetical protein